MHSQACLPQPPPLFPLLTASPPALSAVSARTGSRTDDTGRCSPARFRKAGRPHRRDGTLAAGRSGRSRQVRGACADGTCAETAASTSAPGASPQPHVPVKENETPLPCGGHGSGSHRFSDAEVSSGTYSETGFALKISLKIINTRSGRDSKSSAWSAPSSAQATTDTRVQRASVSAFPLGGCHRISQSGRQCTHVCMREVAVHSPLWVPTPRLLCAVKRTPCSPGRAPAGPQESRGLHDQLLFFRERGPR